MAFLRPGTWAPRQFRALGDRIRGLDADLAWDERLACAMTWTLTHALIDLCFVERPIPTEDLAATIKAWSYLSGVVTYLDHAVGVREDLESGIVNTALVSMRPHEILGLAAFPRGARGPASHELERVLDRAAEFAMRALAATAGRDDAQYACLALLIPTTLLAPWIGSRDGLVGRYFRRIGPAVRAAELRAYHSATYSQQSSPSRTQRAFKTLPGKPRQRSTPS
ncbi:MAG: hypothetical protein E6K18_02515 [Methanobacteriota archaeon]|nr:MAG: hypothetical protein E6K18_02515 [Euryarchaeota archaeon]